MTPEYVIMDASVKYMKARNPLEEGLFYSNDNTWSRNLDRAIKYSNSNSAVEVAKSLREKEGLAMRVLLIQRNGNNIGVGDVTF
jgi:hypothetical protein